jgi:adenine C2-methylase RlmN of 23S rRNA A2503 and tRNA A37
MAIIGPTQLDDFDRYYRYYEKYQQMKAIQSMGIGENAANATPAKNDVNHFRVNAIENGYIVTYSAGGHPERQRYAATLQDVGEQVVVAAVEMKLRGAQQA